MSILTSYIPGRKTTHLQPEDDCRKLPRYAVPLRKPRTLQRWVCGDLGCQVSYYSQCVCCVTQSMLKMPCVVDQVPVFEDMSNLTSHDFSETFNINP